MPMDKEKVMRIVRRHLLTCLTVVGALSGVGVGFILRSIPREAWWSKREIMYIQFPGDLYLRLLNMFILPLLVTSVVTGIAKLNIQASWRVAVRAALWFVTADFIAVLIGVLVAAWIQPGIGANAHNETATETDLPEILSMDSSNDTETDIPRFLTIDTALDIFRNVFPPNNVKAALSQERTKLIDPKNDTWTIEQWPIQMTEVKALNIPGLITFAITLGVATGISLPSGDPLLSFCEVFGKCMMVAIGWIIWLTPLSVIFMVAAKLLEEPDLSGLLERLGLYFITVLIGLFIHSLIMLPSVYFTITRKSPFKMFAHMAEALVTAFGTASSNATLPVTMNCLEQRAGLDSRVVRFLTPIATTMNQNGTALYEAVAIIFISQMRGVSIDPAYMLLVSITVTAASFANAGIPQAGLVTLVLILGSLGLDPQDVTLIVAVDWLLDRFRTTVNVTTCAFAAGVVEHLSQEQIAFIGRGRKYSEVPQADEVDEYELNIRL